MNRERQNIIYNPEEHPFTACIIGIGNIGSHTALALARLGVRSLHLIDDDVIEEHNLSSQAYGTAHIGATKCDAVASLVHDIDPSITITQAVAHCSVDNLPATAYDVLICGVDSLDARREIAQNVATSPVQPRIIIDGRIGGNQLEVHTYATAGEWTASIPAEADPDPCGGKYISYVSYAIASFITNTAKRFTLGQSYRKSFIMHLDTLDTVKGELIAGHRI